MDVPQVRVNLQLLIPFDAESQTYEIQGEEKQMCAPTCDCPDCQDERQRLHGERKEQRREKCEAEKPGKGRVKLTRKMRIYYWRRYHKFPLFHRSQEEREYLMAKRAERKSKAT